jgi:hypothetical protein
MNADFEARAFVSGMKKDKEEKWTICHGEWAARFASHPLARESQSDGWSNKLRSAIVHKVRQHLMAGGHVARMPLDALMPPGDILDHWRHEAKRSRLAEEWRARNLNHPSLPQDGFNAERFVRGLMKEAAA